MSFLSFSKNYFQKGKHLISSPTDKSSNTGSEELHLKVRSVIQQAREAAEESLNLNYSSS